MSAIVSSLSLQRWEAWGAYGSLSMSCEGIVSLHLDAEDAGDERETLWESSSLAHTAAARRSTC